jgi:ribosomal protein S18 acetylase RimI-like enzyme
VLLRPASDDDVEAIAALHADSWRRNYRGSFSDAFLDGPVVDERREAWAERIARPHPGSDTVVADDGGSIVGFVHTVLDDDPVWGALLDNLHVAPRALRTGIGTRLMAASAGAVLERGRTRSLYLWVLEGNTRAQAFYTARGGVCRGSEASEAPGGGTVVGLRIVWPDPAALLPPRR